MTIAVSSSEGMVCPSPRGGSALVYKKPFPQNIALAVTAITTSTANPTLASLSRTAKNVLAFIVRLAECTDPTKPSWAFKTTMAKEIGVSESTVYRGLTELTQAGLIERLKQERKSHNGRLFVSRIKLTKQACVRLGLTQYKRRCAPDSLRNHKTKQASPKTAQQIAPKQEETTLPGGTRMGTASYVSTPLVSSSKPFLSAQPAFMNTAAETELTPLKKEEQSRQVVVHLSPPQAAIAVPSGKIRYAEPAAPQKAAVETSQGAVIHKLPSVKLTDGQYYTLPSADQKQSIKKQPGQPGTFSTKIANRSIPHDLAWLIQDNCLSVTGLLSLMKAARRMGHFLSDIVKLCQAAIQPHTGRTLYAYLRALITKPVDYGYLRAQQDKERVAREQKAAEKAHRESFIKNGMEKFQGRTFVSEEGTYYTFEDINYICTKQWHHGRWHTGSFHAHHAGSLIESLLAGRLREISEKTQLDHPDAKCDHESTSRFIVRLKKFQAHLQLQALLYRMKIPQSICI